MLLLDTGDKTEGFRQFLLYSGVHLRRVSSVLRRQSWPRLHSILRVNIQELGVKIMKFVVIIVASVCANLYFCTAGNTSGNGSQKACPDSKQPITVNVFTKGSQKGEKGAKGDTGTSGNNGSSCQCSLQNPNKPSAHIEAAKKYYVSYKAGQILKDWSVSAPYSHLAGGMKYQDGKLTVPTSGRYYIYVQAYYRSKGRISVHVNNKRVTLVHFPWPGRGDTVTSFTAGVFNLKAGDVITFALEYNCIIYMDSHCTYFGAYLI